MLSDVEIEAIKLAIEISKKCKSESAEPKPKVGAVLIKDGRIIGKAYRGEVEKGGHAEFTLLFRKGLSDDQIKDSTLVTTLEPCTTRYHPKIPCAMHIREKGVRKVIIGLTDPNPNISGRGENYLLDKGIEIEHFPFEYMDQVRKINEEFWNSQMKKYKMNVMAREHDTIDNATSLIPDLEFRSRFLAYERDRFNEVSEIDGKALSSYYVDPKLIKVKVGTWDKEIDPNSVIDNDWSIEKFLNSDSWFTVIGSEFGTGKSSYAKYIANKFAVECLRNIDSYIPILINLAYGFKSNNIYIGYNIEQILHRIVSKNDKILIIFDGLDEYDGDVNELIQDMRDYKEKYRNLKVLYTTRMIDGYQRILSIEDYVRIEPFNYEQVNEFFTKYGVKLSYEYLKDRLQLYDEEIEKQLFAWMIAYMYKTNKESIERIDLGKLEGPDEASKRRIIRTVLYHNLMNSIIRGKHKSEHERLSDYSNSSIEIDKEKTILRLLSALHNIYGRLRGDNAELENLLKKTHDYKVDDVDKYLKSVTESYFYRGKEGAVRIIRFIHRSFQEYFLAEYYYFNIRDNNTPMLQVGLPSRECVEFLHGLVDILKHYDGVRSMVEHIENTEPLIKKEDYDKIISNCKEIIKDERIILHGIDKNGNFIIGEINYANRYTNLYTHRWLAVSVLSWLSSDKETKLGDEIRAPLAKLIRETSRYTPYYLKWLSYADLSNEDLSNADLSDAALSNARLFKTDLSNTNLSHANLSYANLSQARLDRAMLFATNLSGTNLSGAYLHDAWLVLADLSDANLSGAELYRADLHGVMFYLFAWDGRNPMEIEKWLEKRNRTIDTFSFRDNILTIKTKDNEIITIELKEDSAILKTEYCEKKLLTVEEDSKIKVFSNVEVNEQTDTSGIELTVFSDVGSILDALKRLPPSFRKIVLRDNPWYDDIWKKYHD